MHASNRQGFSLVELSIVLVILGLLTGGILSGQSLIRAAELRSVSSDFMKYSAALRAFRDKYFALPGDMNNASKFWGAGTCPGDNSNTTAVAVTTCNGNGDGQVTALATGTDSYGGNLGNEIYRSWQHLANGGIIEGSYLGISASATATTNVASIAAATQNVPKSRIANGGWSLVWVGTIANTPTTTYYEGNYDNVLMFGTTTVTACGAVNGSCGPILKTEDAWNIDNKLDDGKPGTGMVTSLEVNTASSSSTAGCGDTAAAATSIGATSSYNLVNTSANMCTLVFKAGV